MTRSHPLPTPVPKKTVLKPLWSQPITVCPRGLALVREKGWLLTWDDKHWLYLLNQKGERQGQVRPAGELAAACCADDGSAFAAAGIRGEVWWLAPDLSVRWERVVPDKALAAAMDPFGQYLAVADARSHLRIFNRLGHLVTQIESPRPLHHLAFVPAAPYLVASADYGLVTCLDLAGRWVWRDGLVVHIGGAGGQRQRRRHRAGVLSPKGCVATRSRTATRAGAREPAEPAGGADASRGT